MNRTDQYEHELLKRGPRNAVAVMLGGLGLMLGSVLILVLTASEGQSLVFYGAFLGSFGVIAKGFADLQRSKSALRLFEQDQEAA